MEAWTEYDVHREPVRGVRVRARVYGKVDCVWGGERRVADVPAKGFEEFAEGCENDVFEVGRVVKRRPVDRPITEERGE